MLAKSHQVFQRQGKTNEQTNKTIPSASCTIAQLTFSRTIFPYMGHTNKISGSYFVSLPFRKQANKNKSRWDKKVLQEGSVIISLLESYWDT